MRILLGRALRTWSLGTKTCLPLAVLAWGSNAFAIDRAALAAVLEDARVEMEMPGLRAAVRLANGHIVRAAVGLADKEKNVLLDHTIGMPGGSTGKTFVAVLTMLLVEDGTLSLDDPASKWLGDTPWYNRLPNADEILVRHLLSHTAGIKDYPDNWRYRPACMWRALRQGSIRFEPEELIGFVLDQEPAFPVGEGYRYTDAGYLVLGRLIEAASGHTYYDLLQARILNPQHADGRIVEPKSLAQMLEAGWRNPETPGSHYGFGLFVSDGGKSFGNAGRGLAIARMSPTTCPRVRRSPCRRIGMAA